MSEKRLCSVAVEWRNGIRFLGKRARPAFEALTARFVPHSTAASELKVISTGVARKINLMPMHIGFTILILTNVFDVHSRIVHGCGIAYLDSARLEELTARWSRSRIAPCRDLMLLYGRLSKFLYFSLRPCSP
jgi:hypothetical protein